MVAIWLINRQCPLVVVEDPELIEIFKYLNPTAQPVKADAVKNAIMNLYISGKEELKVSFIIIILYHFVSLGTHKIVGILFYNQIQNLLYIRPLDILQQQSLRLRHGALHRR